MRFLKTNTAVIISVGPLVSHTDGYTLKTGLTVTEIEVNMWHEHDDGSAPALSMDGIAPTASAGNNDMTELVHGYYQLEITAAQVNFIGRAKFMMFDADKFLPYFEDWYVLPALVYDSIFAGTDNLQVDVTLINNVATSSVTTVSAYQGTTQPVNFTGTGATAYAKSDVIDWNGTAVHTPGTAGVPIVEIHDPSGVTIGTVTTCTTATNLTNAPTNGDLTATMKTSVATAAWNAATSSYGGAGTYGQLLEDNLNAPIATVDTVVDTLATELAKVPKSDSTVTWNATALASVKTQATGALTDINLDHLMKTPVSDITKLGDGGGNEVPDSTVLSLVLCKGTDTDTYNHTTDSLEAVRDKLPTNLEDLAVTDTTGLVSVGTIGNDVITAASIATDAIAADGLAADAVDEILDEVVEGTTTMRQAIRLILSVLTGKTSGGGTATLVFRDIGDTKNRLSVTVDADGNRTAVGTRDGS